MTDTRTSIVQAIERAGAVAVIRLEDASRLRPVVDALGRGGIRAIEITMTVPGALDLMADLVPALSGEYLVGAGTVLDDASAARAIAAGARFVVSPVFRRPLIDTCHRLGRPMLPGCFSPTEILDAWQAGADIVKVFPATSLGPGFFRDVRAPLPQLKLMPTGGVSVENAGEWIRAGAAAVGIGSALVDRAAVAAGDYDSIAARAARVVASVRAAREALS